MAYELHQLESGAVTQVRTWLPIALLYRCFGFWPAVLFLPVLAALGLISIAVRIRKLRLKDELNKVRAAPRPTPHL